MTLAAEVPSATQRPHSIIRATYDESKRTLLVQFLVGTYTYFDVPPEQGAPIAAMRGDELRWAHDSSIVGKHRSQRM